MDANGIIKLSEVSQKEKELGCHVLMHICGIYKNDIDELISKEIEMQI